MGISIATSTGTASKQHEHLDGGLDYREPNDASRAGTTGEIRNYNKVVLENLGAGTDYEFWVRSVDKDGRYSEAVAWLGTAIGRQTFSIIADSGPVEEGEDRCTSRCRATRNTAP